MEKTLEEISDAIMHDTIAHDTIDESILSGLNYFAKKLMDPDIEERQSMIYNDVVKRLTDAFMPYIRNGYSRGRYTGREDFEYTLLRKIATGISKYLACDDTFDMKKISDVYNQPPEPIPDYEAYSQR